MGDPSGGLNILSGFTGEQESDAAQSSLTGIASGFLEINEFLLAPE
jgi:hypothetical protein